MKNENEIIMCSSDEKEVAWHSYKCVIDKLLEEKRLSFFTAAILIKNIRKSLGLPYLK